MKFQNLRANVNKYQNRQTLKDTSFLSTFFATTKEGKKRPSIRAFRYFCVIFIHLVFVLSFYANLQILEGDISGSRIFGFHLADPFITLEVLASYKILVPNLLIGSISIIAFYLIFGGRAFCAWVCPYGIFSEIAEKIHANLVAKKLIKERVFSSKTRYIFMALCLAFSAFSSLLVFEIFNVAAILSRFIIYGFSFAIFWVVFVFIFEIFFARRFWCKNLCPLGATYSLISFFSLNKISWDKQKCDHCGVCMDVCFVSDVLKITKKNAKLKEGENFRLSGVDCTLCGRCIDVCHHDALSVKNRLKDMI